MTPTRTLLGLVLTGSLFATAACGDDPEALIGSWRALPNALDAGAPPIADRQVLTFLADGTVVAGAGGATSSGTYTVTGDRLTLLTPRQDASPDSRTARFYASDTRFVLDAMTSVDAGDGLIGTWHGAAAHNEAMLDTIVTLRADHTGRFESHDSWSGAGIAFDASWQQQGDDVVMTATISPDQQATFYGTWVDGVLGSAYERL